MVKIMFKNALCLMMVLCFIFGAADMCAAAQAGAAINKKQPTTPEAKATTPEGSVASEDEILAADKPKEPITPDKIPSLFFTFWQHEAIVDAKNSRGFSRPPTEAELRSFGLGEDELKPPPRPEEREITVGGILYKSSKEWTVWMNGKRVTPDALPKEVLDFRVFKDYVEFKWLDDYTNQIFPLRMRAHQRFNMDMRIFLSGQ